MGSAQGARFFVPLAPVPKGRPRFARIGGGVRTRTDKRTKEFEARFALLASPFEPAEPYSGAVRVSFIFYLKAPKRKTRSSPSVKPDIDNLAKSALDSLEAGLWFLKGDQQVTELRASKCYAGEGQPVGIAVEVEPLS